MIVTYVDRVQLDPFRALDTVKTFHALSSFTQGGLTYFKIDRFNYKVIETDFIQSIKEG